MNIFEATLNLFEKAGVHLIVNELEEAPFMYRTPKVQREIHEAMRRVVATRVRALGFSYISVDFDKLTDDDYFDHNHLNSRGAAVFTPMLADQLRPLLGR